MEASLLSSGRLGLAAFQNEIRFNCVHNWILKESSKANISLLGSSALLPIHIQMCPCVSI